MLESVDIEAAEVAVEESQVVEDARRYFLRELRIILKNYLGVLLAAFVEASERCLALACVLGCRDFRFSVHA